MLLQINTTTEQIKNIGGVQIGATLAAKIGVPEIQTTQWPNAGEIFMPILANMLQGRTSY
jgi:hypothetical protein